MVALTHSKGRHHLENITKLNCGHSQGQYYKTLNENLSYKTTQKKHIYLYKIIIGHFYLDKLASKFI